MAIDQLIGQGRHRDTQEITSHSCQGRESTGICFPPVQDRERIRGCIRQDLQGFLQVQVQVPSGDGIGRGVHRQSRSDRVGTRGARGSPVVGGSSRRVGRALLIEFSSFQEGFAGVVRPFRFIDRGSRRGQGGSILEKIIRLTIISFLKQFMHLFHEIIRFLFTNRLGDEFCLAGRIEDQAYQRNISIIKHK